MWHRPARLSPSRPLKPVEAFLNPPRPFTMLPCHQDIEIVRRTETKRDLRTTCPSRRAVPWHCWRHSSCRNSTSPRKGYSGPL